VVNRLKKELRERILTLLRSQKEEERLNKSLVIQNKLFAKQEFNDAEIILFYASFDGEVETFEMMTKALELGKKVGLPKVDKEKNTFSPYSVNSLEGLSIGPYGIKEPAEDESQRLAVEDIDLVVTPGISFDKQNNRLGRGGGYYDRFLATIPSTTLSIGLAFDFQIVDTLPSLEEHDSSVSCVLAG